MAKFTLTTGNNRVKLKNGFVDTVCVESRGRYKVGRFENQDKIDLRNFGINTAQDAQELIENSMPRGRRGVILKGAFGRLVLCGITQEQLHLSNFILGNQPPAARRDTAVTTENTPVSIDVLANDIDPDGDQLFIEDISRRTASGGSVRIDGDTNVVEYTPAEGFTGIDRFRYTISDGNGGTDSAIVTVTVGSENIPPIALDDLAFTEPNTSVNISVLDNDFDPDSESISISDFTTETENGGAVSDSENDTLLYSPTESFTGTDSFSYTISDGLLTDTATVTVTVDPVNEASIPVEDVVLEEPNLSDLSVLIDVLAKDSSTSVTGNSGIPDTFSVSSTSIVVIEDFLPGEDVLQVRGGLTFSDIEITAGTGSSIGNTMIAIESSNEVIAELIGVQPVVITSNDFTFI